MPTRAATLAHRLQARLATPRAPHRPRLPALPPPLPQPPPAYPRATSLPLIGPLIHRLFAGLHTYRTLKARVAHLEHVVATLAARDEALATRLATPPDTPSCAS